MAVRVSKPEFNLREKISELDKPTGVKGLDLMRSETAQDARNLIGAGRKNKVINGDMRISQRGTSFSGITGTQQVYTLDRFKLQCNDLDQVVTTVSQDSSAPDGFSKSLKIQCTTAETSVEDYEHARLIYDGEGFDFTDIGFGTPSAKKVTLSFWVKSNLTGTWGLNFWRGDANRSNLRTYNINEANTWEHKVITLSPDTTGGVVNSDNGYGLRVNWGLATGANFATSHALDTWHSFNQSYFYPYDSRKTNLFSSTSNNFYLTGVQLEVSDVATEFEHRPYAEELKLCERYYEVHWQNHNPNNPAGAHNDGYNAIAAGGVSGSKAYFPFKFRTQKRASPTISYSGKFRISGGSGSGSNIEPDEFYSTGIDGGRIRVPQSGGSNGDGMWIEFDGGNSTSGYIAVSAEL